MARDLTDAYSDALQLGNICVAVFAELAFRSETVYVWSGRGFYTWGGNIYRGLGDFSEISPITESDSLEAQGVTLGISGISIDELMPDGVTPIVSLLTESLGDVQLGNPVKLWLALFDSTGALIADPAASYVGRMDQPVISADGETFSIHLACENRMVDLQRGQNRRYTQMDQQLDYPEDTGMQWMSGLQDWNGSWGAN